MKAPIRPAEEGVVCKFMRDTGNSSKKIKKIFSIDKMNIWLYITTMMNKRIDKAAAVFHLLQELGKVMRIFQSEAVLCEGVTFAQFCILDHAAARGGRLGLSELHGLLSVEKSTTTRMVGPLVKRGLVTREKSGNDSRAIEITLTAKGKDVHEKVWGCVSDFIDGVLQHIPGDRRNSVLDALGIFIRSIRQCCGGSAGGGCSCG
jgi:DNA-binding MarR family transcriptional regulator